MQFLEQELFGSLERQRGINIIDVETAAPSGQHLGEIGKQCLIFEAPKPGQETDEYLKHLEFSTELL